MTEQISNESELKPEPKKRITLHIQVDESKINEAMYGRTDVDYRGYRYIFDPQTVEIKSEVESWYRSMYGSHEQNTDIFDAIKRYRALCDKVANVSYQKYNTKLSATNMRALLSIARIIYEHIMNSDETQSEPSLQIAKKIKEAIEVDEYLLAAVEIKAMASMSNKGNVRIIERFTV